MQTAFDRAPWLRYGAALLVVAVIAAGRLALDPLLADRVPALFFTIAVMIAARFGGLGPGLAATAASAIAIDLLWLPPTGSLGIARTGDRVGLGVFAAIGIAISMLDHAVHVARAREARGARELREREEEHGKILSTITEGIWTLDGCGRITYANRSISQMLGVPVESLIGRSASEFVYEEDRAARRDSMDAILRGERSALELRLRGAGGVPIWTSVSSAPIAAGPGRPSGILATFTDVSARHRAEAELQRLLESEQRARADAEAANRAKDDFLATVSHELRTPLNAMLGWLKMLRTGALDATKTTRALEVIERNARSQAKLIEDLLDVSRMISGKLRIEPKRVSIGTVVTAAIDAMRPTAVEREIEIERAIDPTIDLVAGDPERLKQIVVNLVSNALKFTPQAGGVKVLTRRAADRIEIVVEDTGQGIAAEFLPHVFDRFRQQDGSMTRKHSGLGLGLAIVRHLAELHGGTASAHSDGPGLGARFTISLPALDDASAAAMPGATPALSEPSQRPRTISLGGAKVLVVDDEPDSLEMLRELLARAGAEVAIASSAQAALTILGSFRPDLIVSDLAMPELDGYDLLSRIREMPSERGGRTPAIALTAHARLTDRLRVLSSGFSAYLAKPVEPDELIATARRVLSTPALTHAHA